jgi:hypothetical protein
VDPWASHPPPEQQEQEPAPLEQLQQHQRQQELVLVQVLGLMRVLLLEWALQVLALQQLVLQRLVLRQGVMIACCWTWTTLEDQASGRCRSKRSSSL